MTVTDSLVEFIRSIDQFNTTLHELGARLQQVTTQQEVQNAALSERIRLLDARMTSDSYDLDAKAEHAISLAESHSVARSNMQTAQESLRADLTRLTDSFDTAMRQWSDYRRGS